MRCSTSSSPFLAVALIFLILGAPFAAALEVIIYAGAIMVLFIFVMMMLNPDPRSVRKRAALAHPGVWVGPAILSAVLLAELGLDHCIAGREL